MTDVRDPAITVEAPPAPQQPETESDERARLLAEAEALRQQQLDWLMDIRRYAHRMLQLDTVRRSNSPCPGGTNRWLEDMGVPRLDLNEQQDRLSLGDETHIRRQAELNRMLTPLTPATLASLSLISLRRTVTAHQRHSVVWRDNFIVHLRDARSSYSRIPLEMVEELVARLHAPYVPADPALAPAQGARFPDESAEAAPSAPAPVPDTALMRIVIMVDAELSGSITTLPDSDLQSYASERLSGTVARSVYGRTEGIRIVRDSVSVLSVVHRPAPVRPV